MKGKRVIVGEKLIEVLEKQKNSVNSVTYGVCNISDYDAGEMIAKKILDGQRVF